MELELLEGLYSVCKLEGMEAVGWRHPPLFAAATGEEYSAVCRVGQEPANTLAQESGWRMLRVSGVLDFGLVGILSRLSGVLAEYGVSVFVVSTFDTDYLLIKQAQWERSLALLRLHGYRIHGDEAPNPPGGIGFAVEREPLPGTAEQIARVTQDWVPDCFAPHTPGDVRRDLALQRTAYLHRDGDIQSFLTFTCLNGSPHITLQATRGDVVRRGLGSRLLREFQEYLARLEFRSMELCTARRDAAAFYQSAGFRITGPGPGDGNSLKLRRDW